MNLSKNGERFIQNAESLRLTAYYDVCGKLTIGYGHKILPEEMKLYIQRTISGAEATAIFEKDIAPRVVELNGDLNLRKGLPLTQNQFDALIAFIFNIGVGAWRTSHARTALIEGPLARVTAEMERWIHGDHGEVIKGLVNRRKAEIALFNKPAA